MGMESFIKLVEAVELSKQIFALFWFSGGWNSPKLLTIFLRTKFNVGTLAA
jgi:hypothetical protein